MSDPVSNAEVEDVLSSIRRLVSEDKRPMQNRTDKTGPDRLVLTPALRVEETEESPSEPAATGQGATEIWQQEPLRLSEAEKDQGASQADPAPEEDYSADPYGFDRSDDEDGDNDLAILTETPSEVEAEAADVEEPSIAEMDRDTLSRLLDEQAADDDQQPAEDPSAQAEGAQGEPFDLGEMPQPQDDEANDDQAALSEVEEATEFVEVSDSAEEEGVASEEAHSQSDDEDGSTLEPFFAHRSFGEGAEDQAADESYSDEDEQGRTEALSDKIAQLETAIGNIRDTWEPDGRSGDDYAGTEPPAMAWEDDLPDESGSQDQQHRADYSGLPDEEAETAVAPKSVGATVSDFSKVTGAFASHSGARNEETDPEPSGREIGLDLGGDEQVIDEAVLRDLVSEIVREELQGALGERITRNVRKLVRREIHRALTAQDLN